jgi:hypothetical protein
MVSVVPDAGAQPQAFTRAKVFFVVESRLFFDEIDNNYQFWAGVRYVFH